MSKKLTLEDAYTCIGRLTVENENLKSEKDKYWEWYLDERTAITKLEEELKDLKGIKEDEDEAKDESEEPGADFDIDKAVDPGVIE